MKNDLVTADIGKMPQENVCIKNKRELKDSKKQKNSEIITGDELEELLKVNEQSRKESAKKFKKMQENARSNTPSKKLVDEAYNHHTTKFEEKHQQYPKKI